MLFVKAKNGQDLIISKKKPFELLTEYLSRPNAEGIFAAHARAFALCMLDYSLMDKQDAYDIQVEDWNIAYRSLDTMKRAIAYGKAIYGMWEPRQTLGNLWMYSMFSADDTAEMMNAPIRVLAVLNDNDSRTDNYEKDWNGFLAFFNNMQFVPDSLFMTRKGINAMIYTALTPDEADTGTDSTPGIAENVDMSGWEEIFDYLDNVEKACATEMQKNHVPVPDEVGFELEDKQNGAVIGEASMAWTEKMIVLLLPEQEIYKTIFEKEGWKVLLTNEKLTKDIFGGEG